MLLLSRNTVVRINVIVIYTRTRESYLRYNNVRPVDRSRSLFDGRHGGGRPQSYAIKTRGPARNPNRADNVGGPSLCGALPAPAAAAAAACDNEERRTGKK